MILTHIGNADLAPRRDEAAPSNPQSADNPSTKKTASRDKSPTGQNSHKADEAPLAPMGATGSVTLKATTATRGDSTRVIPTNISRAGPGKADNVLKKLRTARGITLAQIVEITGWQQHSVRGFLSGTVRKKLGLNLVSEVGKDGTRRYRVIDSVAGAAS